METNQASSSEYDPLSSLSFPSSPPACPLRRSRLGTRLRALKAAKESTTEEQPRRLENAFLLFRRSVLDSYRTGVEEDDERRSWTRPRTSNLSKTISLRWKNLTLEERERWERLARKNARENWEKKPTWSAIQGTSERVPRFSNLDRRTTTSILSGTNNATPKFAPPSSNPPVLPPRAATTYPTYPLLSTHITDERHRLDMAYAYEFCAVVGGQNRFPVGFETRSLPQPPASVGRSKSDGDREGDSQSYYSTKEARTNSSFVSKRPRSLDNVSFTKRTKYAYHNTLTTPRRLSRCTGNGGDIWVPLDPPGEDDVFPMRDGFDHHNKSLFLPPLPCHIDALPANEIDLTDYMDRGPLIATGGFSNIYRGKWKNVHHLSEGDRDRLPAVVVKVINLPISENERQKARRLKKLKREFELWSTLNHDNILPLVGIARVDGDLNMPAFVSPWMQDGSVIDFVHKNPSFPVVQFLHDIIKGLHYLHTFDPEIVHGDLKAANILVNHRREACLCDFGLSRFAIENTLWKTDSTQANGTLRWMAPELLQADETVPTRRSDVYAYGMTCYEILSGKTPFESVRNDCAVMAKVIKGDRPDRIDQCDSDDLWFLIIRCWAQDPHDRPATHQVLLIMQDIASSA